MTPSFPDRTNSICVGGTADKGDWSTVAKKDTKDKIWKEATDLLPMLKVSSYLFGNRL